MGRFNPSSSRRSIFPAIFVGKGEVLGFSVIQGRFLNLFLHTLLFGVSFAIMASAPTYPILVVGVFFGGVAKSFINGTQAQVNLRMFLIISQRKCKFELISSYDVLNQLQKRILDD